MFRLRNLLLTLAAVPLLLGCPSRSFEIPPPKSEKTTTKYYPQSIEKDVDLLFVIDDSGSMEDEQTALSQSFGSLIDALVSPKLGNQLPNVHIGVVSSDLGAGSYSLPSCEVTGGKGGKLQNTPRVAGCKPPADPWISSIEGKTNISGCTGTAVECVKQAFSCIGELGIQGCGFEMQLEAARRALDPTLNTNPGFIRKDAFLAVIFITDEDDCSARNPQLFDPQQQALTDPLGPLTSFRCFEFGVQCDVNDRNSLGERKNCVPAYDWLHKTSDYIQFFENLKTSKDRVIMAAIAGPKTPVVVGKDGPNPVLQRSCQSSSGGAVPAIRIMNVVEAFEGQFASVCEPQKFGEALKALGTKIVASLGGQCIDAPLLLPNGGIACHQGTGACKMPQCKAGETCNADGYCEKDGTSTGAYCGSTCLDKVDCLIFEEDNDGSNSTAVDKCPAEYFRDPNLKAKDVCKGNDKCPCWRLVPRPTDCTADLNVSPFGLEIMRADDPPKGTRARALCRSATFKWNDSQVQSAAAHCSPLAAAE